MLCLSLINLLCNFYKNGKIDTKFGLICNTHSDKTSPHLRTEIQAVLDLKYLLHFNKVINSWRLKKINLKKVMYFKVMKALAFPVIYRGHPSNTACSF